MDETGKSQAARDCAGLLERARKELAKRIVGQTAMIDGLLMGVVAGGHILLEGAPGLGKTRAVKSLAELMGLPFRRIQFTPDLLPADLTGTLVWDEQARGFSVRKGPVFTNIILADEINRAPAKVQSALLEAMEERQVTIGETTYPLPNPFFVLATENPIEHDGTYALPEAELDRFLLKIEVPYPGIEEEEAIMRLAGPLSGAGRQGGAAETPLEPVLGGPALAALRSAMGEVFVDKSIERYIVSLAAATRPDRDPQKRNGLYRHIAFGASPRASIALHRLARVRALFEGRAFVTPDDVKTAALPALRHRIVLSYEAEADGVDSDQILSRILSHVPVP